MSSSMSDLEVARARHLEAVQVYHAYHDQAERRYQAMMDLDPDSESGFQEAYAAYTEASEQCRAAMLRSIRTRETLDLAESVARHPAGKRKGKGHG